MKTVHKLVLKSYMGPMLLTFFIVIFVFMLNFVWRYVDELVGRGIGMDVIAELMMYVAAQLVAQALPLATLLAAIMTMGSLGENYELLAMKSAGMSLPKILRPLAILVVLMSIGSFFANNNLTPYATKKMFALIYDIRQQKQNIEFKDGIFFNGMDNMSIRVGKQDPHTKLLSDILIYDNRNYDGNMTTTVADSGYIRLSDDKRYLLTTLYNGEVYDYNRNYNWLEKSTLRRQSFEMLNQTIQMDGFDMQRSDANAFGYDSRAQRLQEIDVEIDSLNNEVNITMAQSYEPLMRGYIFSKTPELAQDSVPVDMSFRQQMLFDDSISKYSVYEKKQLWESAISLANSSRGFFTFDEESAKVALDRLYRAKVEWHKKLAIPVSIMIFFLIGAPLGAIIRRGGLGLPIVVSVIFYVIYYIVTISGEKMAREGTWGSFEGTWLATLLLLPIGVFLTYKATTDSSLFDADWYRGKLKKLKNIITFKKIDNG